MVSCSLDLNPCLGCHRDFIHLSVSGEAMSSIVWCHTVLLKYTHPSDSLPDDVRSTVYEHCGETGKLQNICIFFKCLSTQIIIINLMLME